MASMIWPFDPRILIQPQDPLVFDLAWKLGDPKAIFEYVRDGIEYRMEEGEIWRSPAETIVLGQEDCDGKAILLVSMLKAIGEDAYVRIIKFPYGGHATVVWRGRYLDPSANQAFEEDIAYGPYEVIADFDDIRLDVYKEEPFLNIMLGWANKLDKLGKVRGLRGCG